MILLHIYLSNSQKIIVIVVLKARFKISNQYQFWLIIYDIKMHIILYIMYWAVLEISILYDISCIIYLQI